jgi:hypothetical protein
LRGAEPVADDGREACHQGADRDVDEIGVEAFGPLLVDGEKTDDRTGEQESDDRGNADGRPLDRVAGANEVELKGARAGRLLDRGSQLGLLLLELLLAQLLIVLELGAQHGQRVLSLLLLGLQAGCPLGCFLLVLQARFLQRDLRELDAQQGGNRRILLDLPLRRLRVIGPRGGGDGLGDGVGDLARPVAGNDLDEIRYDRRSDGNQWQHGSPLVSLLS